MRPSRLSLKARIVLAALAILIIHGAFYCAPRFVATRPRLDEAAYADAIAALKETVGAEAVENGNFTIPKIPLSVPYEGLFVVSLTGTAPWMNGEFVLIIRPDSADVVYGTGAAVALPRERAARLWRTLAYATRVSARTGVPAFGDKQPLGFEGAAAVDGTWRRAHDVRLLGLGRTATPGEHGQFEYYLSAYVVGTCLRRLYDDLKASPGSEPGLIGRILTKVMPLYRATPRWPAGPFASIVRMLRRDLCSDEMLGFLRENKRYVDKLANPNAVIRFLRRVPYVSYVVPDEEDFLPPAYDTELAVLEALAKLPPAERSRAALDIAMSPYEGDKLDWPISKQALALGYALRRDPAGTRAELASRMRAGSPGQGAGTAALQHLVLTNYKEWFGDDTSLAEAAAGSEDPAEAAGGNYALYRLTRDRMCLDRLMEIVQTASGQRAIDTLSLLAAREKASPSEADITAAMMKAYPGVRNPEVARTMLEVLARSGDEAARGFVFAAIEEPETFDRLFNPARSRDGAHPEGNWLLRNLAGNDPTGRTTDLVIRIIRQYGNAGAKPDGVAGLRTEVLYRCDERIVPVVEPVLGGEDATRESLVALEAIKAVTGLRAAADPVAFLRGLSDARAPFEDDRNWTMITILGGRMSDAELEAVLADQSSRGAWYLALRALEYRHRVLGKRE